LYPELHHGWSPLRGLRTERWKIVQAPDPEIYDLRTDPAEAHNLYDDVTVRTEVADLFALLADARWEGEDRAAVPMDPDVEAALQSLGYVAAREPAPPAAPGRYLPDPKSRVRLERLLGRIAGAIESGRLPHARNLISVAMSVEADNKEVLMMLGRVEALSGRTERALEILERCLTLPPASADALVWYEMGRVALEAGLLSRAEESFARACAADPLHVDALFNWGVVAYRIGDWQTAAARWRRVLELSPEHPPARQWLPEVEDYLAGRSEP
jgi:tetratricopeptide (TPR) repeat protein